MSNVWVQTNSLPSIIKYWRVFYRKSDGTDVIDDQGSTAKLLPNETFTFTITTDLSGGTWYREFFDEGQTLFLGGTVALSGVNTMRINKLYTVWYIPMPMHYEITESDVVSESFYIDAPESEYF